ncbi:21090_t:CDS:2 [Gigaspora margarita]|uniref:21090_t:CDS:1 n=1 Tax=Gigaspora margarita TaxID=4874 RepID=A0ABN7VRP5_GIGMA|nr:21090_t:CDS:2 [Gigaspora margarita]
MTDTQKTQRYSPDEHKKKVLLEILFKLESASLGCEELDLPMFGEELLRKCEEITPAFTSENIMLKDLKERAEKIKECEPDPDYNIYLAESICRRLCLLCQAENFLITPYHKCYSCSNVDIKDFAYQPNEFEAERKREIEKIVKYLIPQNTPVIVSPETCRHSQRGNPS